MTLINAINGDSAQQVNLVLPNQNVVPITLQYMPNNEGWFISIPSYNINNMWMVVSPNFLRHMRNVLPFGLALLTTDGYEAIFVNDFSTKRASLYLLDAADVQAVEDIIQNVNQVAA